MGCANAIRAFAEVGVRSCTVVAQGGELMSRQDDLKLVYRASVEDYPGNLLSKQNVPRPSFTSEEKRF